MFKQMFKIDWSFISICIIVALVVGLALSSCAGVEETMTQAQEDHDLFVCMESERSGAYAVFSGYRKTRTVIIPKDSNLTKEDWLEVITKCFQSDEQTNLLQLIESLDNQ